MTHQIAVALLDDVAKMNADPKLDASLRQQPGIALDHTVLHLYGTVHGVHHAPELDEDAVAGLLNHPAVISSDCGIYQIAAQRPKLCKGAILVCARKSTIADDIGSQDCDKLPGLGHSSPNSALAKRREVTESCMKQP